MTTTRGDVDRARPRPARRAVRSIALAVAVVLLGPLLAVAASPVSPAAALTPQPIPDDLWDVPEPSPRSSFGYAVIEGEDGDPVTGGQDFEFTNIPGAAFDADPGETTNLLTLIHGQDGNPSFLITVSVPLGEPRVQRGFYPDVSASPAAPGHLGLEVILIEDGPNVQCEGEVTGWVAIDHMREVDDQLGEIDYRFEQSCDGAPPLRAKIHVDVIPESIYGPDPIPDDLWDVTPEGVGDQDYVYVEGAVGDPQTQGVDTLYIGEAFGAGDDLDDLGLIAQTTTGAWLGSWTNHTGRGVVEPGFYPVHTGPGVPAPADAPLMQWWNFDVGECTEVEGWFAVDDILRIDGHVAKLDLRLQQSCDGGPPIHARIHIDRGLPPGSPVGMLETPVLLMDTAIGVEGWAFDPDTVASIDVTYTVDGVPVLTQPANGFSQIPEIPAFYGDDHGFFSYVPVPKGTHEVCAVAKNVGAGVDTVVGCETVAMRSGPPTGAFDVARAVPGGVTVAGWALDPDFSGGIPVHVYVGSKGKALTAVDLRPDVGAAYPGYGPNHGFNGFIQAPPGTHQVCAYAIEANSGPNTFLGCRAVTVPGGSPFGSLDAARGVPGGVVVGGWALDPDTAASIPVHVYAGTKGVALTASGNRPDIGAFFGPYGSAHGFDGFIPVPPGAHQVCAYGINVGVGATSTLACRTVVVPGGSPFGSFDVAVGGAGKVTVAGWAIDPDTAASIPVHVYVANVGTALTAGNVRNDVAAAFPGYGANHGFNATITATSGVKQVCAYGINTGAGGNSLLGCKTVTIT